MRIRSVDMDDALWDALKVEAHRRGMSGAATLVRVLCIDGLRRVGRDPRAGTVVGEDKVGAA